MHRIKAVFISAFLTALVAASVVSAWQWLHGPRGSPWIGTLIAAAAPLLFFAKVFIVPTPRTSANLWWMPALGGAGAIVAFAIAGAGLPVLVALAVGVLLPLVYVFWYSRFDSRPVGPLGLGHPLPDFTLTGLDGRTLHSTELTARPALWVFYRGNWCPFCMAQIREIAAQYRELAARGTDILLVSPQPQSHTQDLAQRFDVPMRFFTDHDNQAAGILGIVAEGGLPLGMQVLGYDSDVPLPTVFITAAGGKIVYCDLTENYRVRPEPAEFRRALTAAGLIRQGAP